jgi:hypothetical protein
MRIEIVQEPPVSCIDGVRLDVFEVGFHRVIGRRHPRIGLV